MEDGHGELGALEPVAGAIGLLAEVAPAVTAAETLDTARGVLAGEVAVAYPAPRSGCGPVECALRVGAERGHLGGTCVRHAPLPRKR